MRRLESSQSPEPSAMANVSARFDVVRLDRLLRAPFCLIDSHAFRIDCPFKSASVRVRDQPTLPCTTFRSKTFPPPRRCLGAGDRRRGRREAGERAGTSEDRGARPLPRPTLRHRGCRRDSGLARHAERSFRRTQAARSHRAWRDRPIVEHDLRSVKAVYCLIPATRYHG